VRRMCLSGEPFTADQLHLEASGAMVCEPGTCEAAAEAIAGQLAALRPQFVRDAKLQLRR
jgi:enoyl-CoA hydratase/carnithine racemase